LLGGAAGVVESIDRTLVSGAAGGDAARGGVVPAGGATAEPVGSDRLERGERRQSQRRRFNGRFLLP
jgi:hypothetical protein